MPSLTRRALLVAALLAVTGAAQAQAWPTKPIKIIVPFGAGTSIHLAVESLQQATGTSMQHVAYKGALEAVTAVITSQANMIFADLPLVLPQIRAGKLRAIAVAGNARIPQLPDTPTIAEGGIKGFGASSWFALAAPGKTPRATVDLINAAFVRALRERYGALTKAAGIKPQ